jgi:hypothetical protein
LGTPAKWRINPDAMPGVKSVKILRNIEQVHIPERNKEGRIMNLNIPRHQCPILIRVAMAREGIIVQLTRERFIASGTSESET